LDDLTLSPICRPCKCSLCVEHPLRAHRTAFPWPRPARLLHRRFGALASSSLVPRCSSSPLSLSSAARPPMHLPSLPWMQSAMVLGLDVDLLVTVRVCIFRRRWPPLCGPCELRSFLASYLFLTMEHQPLLPALGSLPLPWRPAPSQICHVRHRSLTLPCCLSHHRAVCRCTVTSTMCNVARPCITSPSCLHRRLPAPHHVPPRRCSTGSTMARPSPCSSLGFGRTCLLPVLGRASPYQSSIRSPPP
jgi:hypothetical protein